MHPVLRWLVAPFPLHICRETKQWWQARTALSRVLRGPRMVLETKWLCRAQVTQWSGLSWRQSEQVLWCDSSPMQTPVVPFPRWRRLVLFKITWATLVQETQHLLQVSTSVHHIGAHRVMQTVIQLEAGNGDLLLSLGYPWILRSMNFGRCQIYLSEPQQLISWLQ